VKGKGNSFIGKPLEKKGFQLRIRYCPQKKKKGGRSLREKRMD